MAFLTGWPGMDLRLLPVLASGFLHLCLYLCLCLALAPAQVQAADQRASSSMLETQVVAASLFRFLSYVDWPEENLPPGMPYVIGVIGADSIAEELAAVASARTVNERTVKVRRLKPDEPLDGIHELFIGGNAGARQALQRARRLPVLIVTQADGALDQGSMINFRLADGRVRFEVALDSVEDAGLKISSRMLGVALHVRKTTPR